jgi:hypothetical protein
MQIFLAFFRCQRARDPRARWLYQILHIEQINPRDPILAGGCQARAISADRHAKDSAWMPEESEHFFPRFRLPKLDCPKEMKRGGAET